MILSTASLSSVTEKPSIIEDIDFLVGSNSVSYPLADKLRNINAYYRDVVSDIIRFQSNWEFDDTNTTDYPIGTTNLTASVKNYVLPTDFLKLLRVEVLDSQGNYQKVTQFDESEVDIALSEFNKTDGLPVYYREIGNAVELYPAPSASSVTLTAGLKCYYIRSVTEFTNADASVSPGFAETYHRILSYGAAYDYAYTNQLPVAQSLLAKLNEMREAMRQFYSSRNREVRPKLSVRVNNYI